MSQGLSTKLNEGFEVGRTMLWLGSDDANFITGEILVMDGGHSLTSIGYDNYVRKLESFESSLI